MSKMFALVLGLFTACSWTPVALAEPATDEPTLVVLYDSDGSSGKGVLRITEQLGKDKQHFKLVKFKPQDFRAGRLEGFQVVIFSGGIGHKQADALGEEGRAQVKKFVDAGGGYLGICAGSYLACDGFSWGIKVMNARTASSKWQRGRGDVKMELTEQGRAIFGDRTAVLPVLYANGPIFAPGKSETLPGYEPLAFFRTELAEHGTPVGLMVNSPAIVGGQCGKGHVICISPHPEQTEGLEDFIPRAVKWLAEQGTGRATSK